MQTIETREELEQVMQEHAGTLYARVSNGPRADRRMGASRNHQTGQAESGLSVSRVSRATDVTEYVYLLLGQPKASIWLLTGREVGTGSDGEPLVTDWKPVARLAQTLVDALVKEAIGESNLREARSKSWRYADGQEFEIWGERFRRVSLGVVERVS